MDPPSPHEGPGTRLMRLLRRMGFRYSPQCGCQDAVLAMNLWGVEGCQEHEDEILAVMQKNAADPVANPSGIPWNQWGARRLLRHCVK